MKLLKTFKSHGTEVKIFDCWENTMRISISTAEGLYKSLTCPFDAALENSDAVKNFLNHIPEEKLFAEEF